MNRLKLRGLKTFSSLSFSVKVGEATKAGADATMVIDCLLAEKSSLNLAYNHMTETLCELMSQREEFCRELQQVELIDGEDE